MNIVDLQNYIELAQKNRVVFMLLILWTLVWKGLALWKSSRDNKPYWFVAMLVINTVGILEILYIFVFSKMRKKEENEVK